MTYRVFAPLLGLVLAACTAPPPATLAPAGNNEARTAAYLEQIRDRPPYLDAFLRRMPKGGDLHNHLSGAVYAESYLHWAADDGLCVVRASLTALAKPPCHSPDQVPAAEAESRDPALYGQLIDALSMRDFLPISQSGHDHFFATFSKFGAAGDNHFGDMLAEVTDRAAGQSVSYLELMESSGMGPARAIGKAAGWTDDLAALHARLMGPAMTAAVAGARHEVDVAESAMRRRLHCGSDVARPGCVTTCAISPR